MAVKIGDLAPQFTLENSEKHIVSLSDFKGKNVVLYFFPRSDTPGCTKESCSFRDMHAVYAERNIVVLGASYDSPEVLHNFKVKYNLPFILLSDNEKKVAKEYGAYKSVLNMLYPERMTFLIDKNGVLINILQDINISTQAEDIIKMF